MWGGGGGFGAAVDWTPKKTASQLPRAVSELVNHLHNSKSSFPELPFFAETLRYKVSSQDTLYLVENVQDLGVMVSSDLSWEHYLGYSELATRPS